MRERPILFSTGMVRAIICGKKTQTRRVVTGAAASWLSPSIGGFLPSFVALPGNDLSPFGFAGDVLWVRETFRVDDYDERDTIYAADASTADLEAVRGVIKWRPGIHMPRSRARIKLGITDLSIERLQAITEEDAIAEGIEPATIAPAQIHYADGCRGAYGVLWDALNRARGYGWETDPWVWVLRFKLLEVRSGCMCGAEAAA